MSQAGSISRVDPMPAGMLAMYFFLASEAMFFLGLLSAFLVLNSGNRELYDNSGKMLSGLVACGGIVLLCISSSVLLKNQPGRRRQLIALGCALGFSIVQAIQWEMLSGGANAGRHTIVATLKQQPLVFDGLVRKSGGKTFVDGRSIPLRNGFDIHTATAVNFGPNAPGANDVRGQAIGDLQILQDADYGPRRNGFFASYFVMSIVHVLHILGGVIVMAWLLLRSAARSTPVPDGTMSVLVLYWHFVNIIGIVGILMFMATPML